MTVYNINIPGYVFVNTKSPTYAGGVGIYTSQELEFIRRRDLETAEGGIESCWIEITRTRQKNVVIGCLYRHPLYDCGKFHNMLQEILDNLNKRGKEAFVPSDANIYLLHYNRDSQTTDYLDMLFDLGYMPLITKPRTTHHSATLIDRIYTNVPHKVAKAGICLADISDHLPVFCTVANKLPLSKDNKYFRDFSHFDNVLFLSDLGKTDFHELVTNNINDSMNNVISALQFLTDNHVPLRKQSNKQMKQLAKPWLTKAALNSIKQRQKLFVTHFLNNDPEKVKFYKTYNNKLNRSKEAAKKLYF